MVELNKTIKYFYSELFNHGSYTKLIIPYNNIKKLDKLYKDNFNLFTCFNDFELSFPEQFLYFKKSKSAYKEVQKQFANNKGLQPCILTECFIAQTIANRLGLDQFADLDDPSEKVPLSLTAAIFSAKGYSDGSKFRYCYYDSRLDTILFQCGACGTVDIVFTKYNSSIRVEVKEQVAKLEECDITGLYGEDGKLIISDEFKIKRFKYVPYIKLFNELTNIFLLEGHNFKIDDYMNIASSKEIIDSVLGTKVIDVFVLVVNDSIIPVLADYLTDFVGFKGSEIRTAGRNYSKVFTYNFLLNKIKYLGGSIDDNIVKLPFIPSNRTKGRGTDSYNRYSIGSLFFVKLADTNIANDIISFKIDKIWQKKPTISIHLISKDNPISSINQFSLLNIVSNSNKN